MDCESPSEDEDVESKMYAMIHFVDSENPTQENDANASLGEDTNSNCHFINEHGIPSIDDAIKNNVFISKSNVEQNENQKTSKVSLQNSKQSKNNQRCTIDESNYIRTVSMQKISSKDVNKPEFLVTISIKNNDKDQHSVNETVQESGSTDMSEDAVVTHEQCVRLCDSEMFSKKIITPQTPKKNKTAPIAHVVENPEQNERSILIRDLKTKVPNSNRKKTNSTPLKPVIKSPKKPKDNGSSKSTNIQIINLDSSSDDESDVEVIPQPVIPVSLIYVESSDDESIVRKSPETITAEVKCLNVSVEPETLKTLSKTQRPSNNITCQSPTPSVMSSVSDEFILADCSNLNITSNESEPSNLKFNFELHGVDLCDDTVKEIPKKRSNTTGKPQKQSSKTSNKITCVSPVPSVMSSVSDEFIMADCSNLNITSDKNEPSSLKFNFELHGADLCDAVVKETPKRRSKKKSLSEMETVNVDSAKKIDSQDAPKKLSSLISNIDTPVSIERKEDTFATPKCNAKKKNPTPKSISYTVNNIEYVTPSIDVYESESSDFPESVVDVPVTFTPKRKKKSISLENNEVDSLVMANVIGIDNSSNIDSKTFDMKDTPSAKVNKKKKNRNKVSQSHSEDQDCFIIFDSGADFDHIKLQREMPNGKEYWPIDLADKLREKKYKRSQVICGFCNKAGHRDDNCYSKPKKCAMCGIEGHKELRCPNKICLNCGNRNDMFTSDCGICLKWRKVLCAICKTYGHPSDRCPDIWRRYHRTISFEIPLIEEKSRKSSYQLFCSGCTGRGHLINTCKEYISFTEFKIPSPYIFEYTPVYGEIIKQGTDSQNLNGHQMTMKRKGDKECIASHSKKPSDYTSIGQENTPSHILLTQDSLERLYSLEGQKYINAASAKFNLSIKQSKTDLGDILLLTGNRGQQEEFQFEFRKWMHIKEPVVRISTKCRLPKNKTAAVNYIMSSIKSLNKDFGDPQIIHNNLQSFEKQYKKMIGCQNKLINNKKMQSLCSKINNARQTLNKILIGQAGFDDGHAYVDKLRNMLVQLKYSDGMVVNNQMRNQITASFLPIFSEAPRDDYLKLINMYNSNGISLTLSNPKNQKKSKLICGEANFNKKKGLLDRIHMTRRKLEDSFRSMGGDPFAMVDSTWKLLDMCEYQIQNNQTSKDTFYNLRKATSRVDKFIVQTQRFI